MGSGKSTLGKKLAALLSYEFIDLDTYIEQQKGDTITNIFQEQGEAAFRILEKNCLDNLLLSYTPAVVALGGGTVCFHDNLEKIKKSGVLVYIDLGPKTLAQRLSASKTQRPLLKGLDEEQLLVHIEQLLAQRLPYYTQAHLRMKGLNLTAQDIYSALLDHAASS